MSRQSEKLSVNGISLARLRTMVAAGEGLHLEFKRKAAFPKKIAREMIAFANTEGGTLLIGVEDNKTLAGVKYPEEESLAVKQALEQHSRPPLFFEEEFIPLSEKRFIVKFNIPRSERRPHCLISDKGEKETYVRRDDMSIKASREMREIIRRSKSGKGVRFLYGDPEDLLMKYLDEYPIITLDQFRKLARLKKFIASRKLVLLVLARVLKITPTEKGDIYSRV